jgi:hypothetical protein
MVRLVFRPYTQIRRSICTSESLRASTRVSSGFTLFRHSSPSFGSQHTCSCSDLSTRFLDRPTLLLANRVYVHFHSASGFLHPNTRMHARLLGPCFKTGRLKPFRQQPRHQLEPAQMVAHTLRTASLSDSLTAARHKQSAKSAV